MPRKFLGGTPTVATTPVVIESRTLTATDPITIAGTTSADLSADRTIAVKTASTTQAGVTTLSTTTPGANSGAGSAGTEAKAAKGDHYHPTTGLALSATTISTTAPLTGGGDLSANRTLAISDFTGDSGSGGAKGAVPAPASGDAAAGKFLKADGTWAAPTATVAVTTLIKWGLT